jgi:hypothetical protein
LSSAILYLAIVAIWACVLVPRWLHRAHDTPAEQELSPGQEISPEPEEAADRPEAAGRQEASGPGEVADAGEPAGVPPEFATLREQVVEAEAHVAWEDHAAPADPSASEGSVASARFAAVSYSVTEVSVSVTGPGGPDGAAVHDEPAPQADTATAAGDDPARPPGPPGAPGRSRPRDAAAGHAHVLRARRRMLTMLVTLAIATAGATFVGLTAWWVVIPPAALLGGYLLLLREAAHADGEIARRRAEGRARAMSAARERARLARAAAAQPIAEIIDISALAIQAGDQPYDQYADAEIRAVGD